MKTEVNNEYCVYEGMKITIVGAPKADQTTLSLPLSFQFEHDKNYSLWCQSYYDCYARIRQGRGDENRRVLPEDDAQELNVGSVLFATPKENATVLVIDEAYRQEDLKRLLAQNIVSDVTVHTFCDSGQEPKAVPEV
jgi:hypothetical protein